MNSPAESLKPEQIQNWLNSLINSAKIPKGSEKEKTYGHCRDNAVASIGKIVKAHGGAFDIKPYISAWLTYLPMKHDKGEAVEQHELLVDLMVNKPDVIVGTTQEDVCNNIGKILGLYAEINSNPKITNDAVKGKMSNHINSLQSNQALKDNLANIWNHLSEKQRKELNEIASFKPKVK